MSAPCGFLRLSEKKTKLKGRTFSSLIYARAVHLCSKYKTFHEVLPNLYDPVHFSDDQLLDGLAFLENDYEKFVEIFTVQTDYVFGLDTSKTCFDGTNFYKEYITYAKFNPHCTYKEYMNSNSSTARFKKAFESMFEDISYLGKDPRIFKVFLDFCQKSQQWKVRGEKYAVPIYRNIG